MKDGPLTKNSTILLSLATLGTVTSVWCLKAYVGRVVRKLVNFVDPILPSEEYVESSVYRRPLIPLETIQEAIKEKPRRPVIMGAEQTIVWANQTGQKTPLCVVFLHGWGACRQECRPVPERVAQALGANLYCGRLPGHGRVHKRGRLGGGGPDGDSLVEEAHPRELFLSAVHALRVGLSLGDRVVLLGMSTGGALATWLSSLKVTQPSIAALVLVSPAYALGHPLYPVLKHTFSTLRLVPFLGSMLRSWLIQAAVGKTKTTQVLSQSHNRFNTLTYPSKALLHLLDVLWELEAIQHWNVLIPTCMIGNASDHVVDFRVKAVNCFLRFGDAPKLFYCVTRAEHPHVIASEMLSPSVVDEIVNTIALFLKENVPSDATRSRNEAKRMVVCNSQSVPSGLSNFASFPSLADLTRPLQA